METSKASLKRFPMSEQLDDLKKFFRVSRKISKYVDEHLSSGELRVDLFLIHHMNPYQNLYIATETEIAQRAHASRKTVISALRKLKQMNLLRIKGNAIFLSPAYVSTKSSSHIEELLEKFINFPK